MNPEVVCAQPTYVKDSDPQISQFRRIGSADYADCADYRDSGPRLNIKATAFNGVKIGDSVDLRRFPKSECHNGVAIRRVWTFLFDKNNNIGRILNSTSCFFSMLPRLFSSSNNALMVFNTKP